MSKETGCLTDGEMGDDNSSRIESKRAPQGFLDDTEQDLLPNKKQAVGSSNSQSFSGLVLWENSSSFRSVPFSYGGIRKVKINEVEETDYGMSFLIGDAFSEGEINTISFGGIHDDSEKNSSARIISSHDMLMSQSSVHQPHVVQETESVDPKRDIAGDTSQVVNRLNTPNAKSEPKTAKKAPKKAPPANNFPSNARSLLATGMLDGVHVKYVSWPYKELHGTIKGPGYLCSCESCNFSKTLNAYEFERHAGKKTKHPNSHIFFDNGKSVYAVVQELRHTPQRMLFEVIQTVTGSPINQKNFNNWKESYEAATRELQRIYGKEDLSRLFQTNGS